MRACALLAAVFAIAASITLCAALEVEAPLYQRRAASEMACRDAANALLRQHHLPSGATFADDCSQPKVTPVSNRPGYLIVTRVVHARAGDATADRTYSILMDGREFDAWRLVEVRSAPNELSIVQAPPAISPIREPPGR